MRIKKVFSLLLMGILPIIGCATSQTANVPTEPTVEYFKLDGGKLKPGKVTVNAYFEIEKGGKIYVFSSTKTNQEFEMAGKTGKSPITGIGFGPNGETVIFESSFAQKEYENRHKDLLE